MIEEFAALLTPLYAVKNPRTGKVIKFNLKPHENKYLFYHAPNGTQYCYTPHKDVDNWYYSFAYVPQGPGARTGNATHWKLKKLRPHRTRKAARARALAFFKKSK